MDAKLFFGNRLDIGTIFSQSDTSSVNPVGNGISQSGGMLGVSGDFSSLRDADSLHEVSDLCEYLEFLKSSLNKTW